MYAPESFSLTLQPVNGWPSLVTIVVTPLLSLMVIVPPPPPPKTQPHSCRRCY